MRYLTCSPQAETLGINVLAFANNLEGRQASFILEKCGAPDIRTNQWIPAQRLLDALNDLAKSPDFSSALVTAGMQASRIFPTPIKDPPLADVLRAWDAAYQSMHRRADVGHITAEMVDDRHCRVTFSDLYPDDFNYGVLYGFAQRYLPPGDSFTIYYDPAAKPRDRGGEQGFTVIHARWG